MTMRGGGYAKGKRAGDFFMTAAVDGGSTLSDFSLVSRSGATYINVGAGWQRTSLPGAAPAAKMGNPFAGFDFTSYVKDVSVGDGILVDGEPTTKITGVIDTDELVNGVLGQISGSGAGPIDVSKVFGDVRVVAFISDRTHLVRRGLIDFPMDIGGEKVELHIDFALDGANEPVKIPNPA